MLEFEKIYGRRIGFVSETSPEETDVAIELLDMLTVLEENFSLLDALLPGAARGIHQSDDAAFLMIDESENLARRCTDELVSSI